jgi:hypothetical protein
VVDNTPIGVLEVEGRHFNVYTLPSYMTAYYYVKELGSVNHYQTLRRLQNAIKRAMKAGKLS